MQTLATLIEAVPVKDVQPVRNATVCRPNIEGKD